MPGAPEWLARLTFRLFGCGLSCRATGVLATQVWWLCGLGLDATVVVCSLKGRVYAVDRRRRLRHRLLARGTIRAIS